jgi:hypothetical protein
MAKAGLSTMSTAKAVAWLRQQFVDGAKPATLIRTKATAAGHSWASVRRAKPLLKIDSEKRDDQWFWLPPAPEQDAHAPAAETQGAQVQGAQTTSDSMQDAHPLTGSQGAQSDTDVGRHQEPLTANNNPSEAQDAQPETPQGAQPAPRAKRLIMVRRRGVAAVGENEMTWEEFETIGCDQSRVAAYIRQRDAERKANNVEAA